MGDHAESEGVDGRAMAKDVPEGVLDTLRQYRPDVVEDIERAASIKRSRDIPDRSQEDKIAEDYSWLWDFEYQGVRLNAKEIEFIIQYASGGFKHIPGALVKAGFNPNTDPWAKPHVCAALHEATKSLAKAWQINPAKAARQIQNIATSNITDIADIDQNGIRLKDLNSLPREITDSIMEIHETRNHQGTQVRIRMYDKLAALNTMLKLMGAMPDTKVKIEVSGLETRLASALQRLGNDSDIIEGELLES